MTAVLAIEAVALVHLRGASTASNVLPWIYPVPRIAIPAASSLLLILFTGGYLAMQESASHRGWPHVAAAGVVILMVLGALTGRKMRAVRREVLRGAGTSGETMERLRDPFLKVSLCVRICLFLAIFVLVSAKPGLLPSIAIVVIAAFVGLPLSKLKWSRRPVLSVARAGVAE